jgi:hypothetical protein
MIKPLLIFALCLGSACAGATPTTTPRIVAATNAFLATLDDADKAATRPNVPRGLRSCRSL